MSKTRLLTTMAVLVAIGTIGSEFIWFPAGVAKAYPVQHAINVITAILLGPLPAVTVAFMIGVVRNLLGIGTLLAFPGGMVGACLAGVLFRWLGRTVYAVVGEFVGTGVIGSLLSVPFANLLMGSSVGALFFLPPFLVSSGSGALIGWLVAVKIKQNHRYILTP